MLNLLKTLFVWKSKVNCVKCWIFSFISFIFSFLGLIGMYISITNIYLGVDIDNIIFLLVSWGMMLYPLLYYDFLIDKLVDKDKSLNTNK